jgi:uncharacterized membrane protein HdeD (DUF308 family)
MKSTGSWAMLALRGLATLLFGLIALSWPELSVRLLVTIFGLYAIVEGALSIVHSLAGMAGGQRWGLTLLEGLVSVAVGIAVFVWPALTAVVLLYFIAVRALAIGILEMFTAVSRRREVEQGWLLFLGGLVSAAVGLFLIVRPGDGALALLWLIALYAIVVGLVQVVLAFALRRRERQAGPPPSLQETGG